MSGRGKNQNSIKNLKMQKKGEPSINPKGKPPGTPDRSTIMRKMLAAVVKQNGKPVSNSLTGEATMTYADAINAAAIKKALAGNIEAFKELQDTLHGKITEKKELTGKDGAAMLVQIIDDIP